MPAIAVLGALTTGLSLTFACNLILGTRSPTLVPADDAGADGSGDEPGPAETCGLAMPPGACQACVAAQCCDRAAACAATSGCASYETCLLRCGGDYDCRAACVVDHPVGTAPEVPALDQCIASSCADACSLSCGLTASYGEPGSGQACQDCVAAHACGAVRACGTSLDCLTVGHCVFSCRTSDCQAACYDADDAGASLLAAAVVGLGACTGPCQVGAHWDCVGSVAWPFAKATAMAVKLTVLDSVTFTGVQGARVEACDLGDAPCASPRATGTTDAQGVASLVLPPAATAPFGFSGYFDVSVSGYVTTLYVLSYPLSEPRPSLATLLFTTKSFGGLASEVDVVPDPARGHIAVVAWDCWLIGAPGVSFTAQGIDGSTQLRYVQGTLLSQSATVTDSSGLAFFLNAPAPAAIAVTSTPSAIGRPSGRVGVVTRAGAIAVVDALPTR